MRRPRPCFIDSGAWIALAVVGDPYHVRASDTWARLTLERCRLCSSIPVVIETFTFLERNTDRSTALLWKDSLADICHLRLLECTTTDLAKAWAWFMRKDLHKLSAVDATSFTLMQRHRMTRAFTFDTHFATAGFSVL